MKIVAAILLAALGCNIHPSVEDIKYILGSVGAECDEDKIKSLLDLLKGKDLVEVIASGRENFASVPSGGGVAVAVGGGAAVAAAAPVAEAKKEEKVEEKEESDDDMGFSLFD